MRCSPIHAFKILEVWQGTESCYHTYGLSLALTWPPFLWPAWWRTWRKIGHLLLHLVEELGDPKDVRPAFFCIFRLTAITWSFLCSINSVMMVLTVFLSQETPFMMSESKNRRKSSYMCFFSFSSQKAKTNPFLVLFVWHTPYSWGNIGEKICALTSKLWLVWAYMSSVKFICQTLYLHDQYSTFFPFASFWKHGVFVLASQ